MRRPKHPRVHPPPTSSITMPATVLRLLAMAVVCDSWRHDGNARTAADAPSSLVDIASRTSWMHPGPCTIP
eukprot:1965-Eustigmatos_ZCMA.PRE.1